MFFLFTSPSEVAGFARFEDRLAPRSSRKSNLSTLLRKGLKRSIPLSLLLMIASVAIANAAATVSPTSLSWNWVTAGGKGGQKTATLTNGNSSAITISSIALGGSNPGDFQIYSKTCGTSLAASASCSVSIVFAPTTTGSRTAKLTFTDSDSTSPQTVALSGTGTSAGNNLTVSPSSLSFGSYGVGSTSGAQQAYIYNGSSVTDTFSSISISGTNAGDFSISSKTCGTSIAPPTTCSVSVVFKPAAAGARSATLTLTDSAANSPQTVALSGTGGSTSGFSISPTNPGVAVNGSVQFSATSSATWKASCGSINASGLYTAPSTTGSCTVTGTQTASPYASASTTVSVKGSQSGSLAIYPTSASVASGTQQVFQAQLNGVPDSNSLSYTVDGVAGGNSTTGTITNLGLYTAPSATGWHTIVVKDNTLGTTSSSYLTVYNSVWVDFGSRAANANPVPAGLFAAQRLESLHNSADLGLVQAGGITSGRMYAQIVSVFQTSTPNWPIIDGAIRAVTANGGVHVLLQMYQSPAWLQQNNCGVYSLPSNINTWASIAAQYVKHMDTTFPGVVTDYEIWNEPNQALCVPSGDNALTDYMNLYRAAAVQMKAQAKADGTTIRVGGPATAGLAPNWVTAMLSDATISQNIDFMSYHTYLMGAPGESAKWDTYNGVPSVYQLTQDSASPANTYEYAGTLDGGGKQPQGKNLPIYITEYNLDWEFAKNCCSNDYTYGPLWNAMYVADMLDVPFAYNGAPNSLSRLVYYAATAPPYYCLVGEIDTNMDCTYPSGSTPQPYPQYFAYQLFGSPTYLGLQNGGYMASAISPPRLANGLIVTAFFTGNQDSIVLINPSQYTYNNTTVYFSNPGYSSPQGTLYKISNGQSIQSSSVSIQNVGGSNFAATVSIPPYSVQAIAIRP